jgi:hypothetical protein
VRKEVAMKFAGQEAWMYYGKIGMKFAGQEAWMYYGKIGKICDKNETSIEYQ